MGAHCCEICLRRTLAQLLTQVRLPGCTHSNAHAHAAGLHAHVQEAGRCDIACPPVTCVGSGHRRDKPLGLSP